MSKKQRLIIFYLERKLFCWFVLLAIILSVLSYFIHLDLLIGSVIFFLGATWTISRDPLWNEKMRAIAMFLVVLPIVVISATSLFGTVIILEQFEVLSMENPKRLLLLFTLIYCLQTSLYFNVIHLKEIKRCINRQRKKIKMLKIKIGDDLTSDTEAYRKEIKNLTSDTEAYLNRLKVVAAYIPPLYSIPNLFVLGIALVTNMETVRTNLIVSTLIFIFVFLLAIIGHYRAVIDKYIYDVKYSGRY